MLLQNEVDAAAEGGETERGAVNAIDDDRPRISLDNAQQSEEKR